MLAHYAEGDAALTRGFDHGARGFDGGGYGLLHLDVLAGLRADLDGLQAEIGESAHVDVIDFGVAADLFVGLDEFGAVLIGELPAGGLEDIRADGYFVSDVAVSFGMLVRDRAGSDHSYSHWGWLLRNYAV